MTLAQNDLNTVVERPISIEVLPKLNFGEYSLFNTLTQMRDEIEAGQKIRFTAKKVTKTMISTVIECGKVGFSVNLDLEGFNLWEKEEYNMLECRSQKNILFKLTKKHNKEEYLSYLAAVINWVFEKLKIERTQEVFSLHTAAFDAP